MEIRDRNIFLKYFEIYLARLKIALKTSVEYKAQMYSMLIFDTVLFFVMIFFYTTFLGGIGFEILGWGFPEFVLLYCFNLLGGKFLWLSNLYGFSHRLLSGEINQYLVRPVSCFIMSSSKLINGQNFVSMVLLFSFTIFWLFYHSFSNIFFVLSLMFLGWVFYSLFYLLFDSLSFFIKNTEFITYSFKIFDYRLQAYTPAFFRDFKFFRLLSIFPCVLYSYLPIEVARGNFIVLDLYLIPVLMVMIFMTFTIYLLWKFGLKRYEGFD